VPSKVGRPARQIADAPAAGGRERAVTKLSELVMILDLHRQGPSVRAITRQLGVDLETVRAYIAKGLEPPVYKRRAPTPGIVDHFEAYLRGLSRPHRGAALAGVQRMQLRWRTASYAIACGSYGLLGRRATRAETNP
jgi:hypothetical protein